jgi:hypothetical protein
VKNLQSRGKLDTHNFFKLAMKIRVTQRSQLFVNDLIFVMHIRTSVFGCKVGGAADNINWCFLTA